MKSHEQENIKVVKGFYEAVARGELGPVRETLAPDAECSEPNVPGRWLSGPHRGADAVWSELIEPGSEEFENLRVDMRWFHAVGDHVIAIGNFHGRARTTGKELDVATAHICTLRGGKIVRFDVFHDSASWLETLGLAQRELERMAA